MNGKNVNFNISFDPEAGALYIKVSPNKIMRSIELQNEVIVDVDAKGDMVGIEYLNPCKINVRLEQIIKVFNAPQLRYLNPAKLESSFRELAEAVPCE
jgi:uncharacterized protein YuzE